MTDKPEFPEGRRQMSRLEEIESIVDNAYRAISLRELHAAGCELRTCTAANCERSFVTQRESLERLCRHHRKGC